MGQMEPVSAQVGEAFEGQNYLHAHLALNPVLFFLETRTEMDGGYDLKAVQASQALMSAHFHIAPANDKDGLLSLLRRIAPAPGSGPPQRGFHPVRKPRRPSRLHLFGNP